MERVGLSFREQVDRFLRAVSARDRFDFMSFLDDRLAFCAILPGPLVLNDARAFSAHQDAWFAARTGRFAYEILRAEDAGELGFSGVRVEYQPPDAAASRLIYVTLIFRRDDGGWRLIHVQNTLLTEGPDFASPTSRSDG